MAKNLLIRNLDKETNKALERFKDEHYMKNNTDVAIHIIKNYHGLLDSLQRQKQVNIDLQSKNQQLKNLIQRIFLNERNRVALVENMNDLLNVNDEEL